MRHERFSPFPFQKKNNDANNGCLQLCNFHNQANGNSKELTLQDKFMVYVFGLVLFIWGEEGQCGLEGPLPIDYSRD